MNFGKLLIILSLTFKQFITADDNVVVSYEPTDAEILECSCSVRRGSI